MHRRNGLLAGLVLLAATGATSGQTSPINGIRPAENRTHAIVGATVVAAPGRVLEDATIVFRDGVIVEVGSGVDVPQGARTWSCEGLTVYPGLIDAAVLVETPGPPEASGRHWNAKIHPEVRIADGPALSTDLRESMRKLGFTAAAVYPSTGILRGSGAVVSLADDDGERLTVYDGAAAMAASFERAGSWGNPSTPGSLMGAIALLRQTLYDARWHERARAVYAAHPAGNEPPMPADALVALRPLLAGEQAVLFDVSSELDALRAARVAEEFDLDLVLLGNGMEFRRAAEIASLDAPVIVPVEFPKRPDVSDLGAADGTSLRELMTWEQAPTNARRLEQAGVTIALTTYRLKRRSTFHAAVENAIRHGLDRDAALAAVTTAPATLLGVDRIMGTIEPGKLANLVVVEGELLIAKPKIRDTWIEGRRHEIEEAPEPPVAFAGRLETSDGRSIRVELDTGKPSAVFHLEGGEGGEDEKAETKTKAKQVTVVKERLAMLVDGRPFGTNGYVQLTGAITDGVVTGTGAMPDGARFAFSLAPDDEAAVPADGEEAAAPADATEAAPIAGEWMLTARMPGTERAFTATLTLSGPADGLEAELEIMGRDRDVEELTYDAATGELSLRFEGVRGPVTLEVTLEEGELTGTMASERMEAELTGMRGDGAVAGDDLEMPPDQLGAPLGAYGLAAAPQRENVLVTNATIWTAGDDGVIENGSMLVIDGRIAAIGAGPLADARGARVIDLGGRHVTPGLIDCHSHTGISGGVNEFPQTNTAEVRIGDVVNPDDVNWYRQLAGGLTAANLLHGSANPIGGQNAVVKLKWGGTAGDFLVDDAPPGIKFALGENVKRSRQRYPNTRMGVETFIRDAFTAAREYAAEHERYASLPEAERPRTMPPQSDLELDALVEILAGERLVHCHSYRQDEILALIRIAEDFGFRIGTFQHVLEGYKVADAIASHGAGGSSFSDWWAYKVEVMDAIPHNGALMTRVGVLTSFNSDSSELARRMNTEAAKAVRYGGLEPHEALELVTLNPAKQLGIDHRTGSLETGKDADFAVWSAPPLSTYARCEQTWIEGARYFDLQRDREHRERIDRERQRILQKILALAHGDAPQLAAGDEEDDEDDADDPAPSAHARRYDAETIRWMEEQVRLGRDPFEVRPGDCGCGALGHLAGDH